MNQRILSILDSIRIGDKNSPIKVIFAFTQAWSTIKERINLSFMKKIFLFTFFALCISVPLAVSSLTSRDPSVQKFAQSMDFLYARTFGTFSSSTENGITKYIFTPAWKISSPTSPLPPAQNQERIRLTQHDLSYLGAFRLPKEANGPSRFGYGGGALAFNPHGDPNGANDGYPGSLYILGHEHDQMLAEVNIPSPIDQRNKSLSSLNTAGFLHGFVDITGGLAQQFDAGNGYRVDGLAYLEAQGSQASPKIYWTARTYYNVDGSSDPSHGLSDADLSHPNAKGMWRLGDYTGMMTGGYIFPVPSYFADAYLGRKRLISGLFTQQGVSHTSQGPAMFAYGPWLDDPQNKGITHNSKLATQALLYYPYTTNFTVPGGDPIGNFPDHQVPDHWEAASWVHTPEKHAVLLVGRRAMGVTYYGDARPNDCDIYKGYHGEPYEPRILFYDPADLALAAQNKKDPTTIVPYIEWNPSQFMSKTCDWELTGAVYDEKNKLLYIMQTNVDTEGADPTPLLYVFKIKS